MCLFKRGRALSPPENININLITPVFNELVDPRALDHLSTSAWITAQTPGGPKGGIPGKRGLIKRLTGARESDKVRGEDGTGSGENKKKKEGKEEEDGEREREGGRKEERIVLEMKKLRGFEARE